MNKHGLVRENLLATLPLALQRDPSIVALSRALAEVLSDRPEEIDQLRIYPDIDRLDEELLDILAYDFKVDWWDPDCTLEQKRRLLKSSWQVHKVMGTKAAVEAAASAVYPYARVQEWFEYGGEPYWFRMDVDLPEEEWTQERHVRLMRQVQFYKSLRSHLELIIYRVRPVVLENRQAFWFTALNISAWAENRRGLALERFRLHMRAEQAQGTALYLHTRSRMKQPQALAFSQLLVHLRGSNFPPGIIYLDGRRRLDGTWRLGQHGIRGPALHCFSARFRAVTRPVLRSTVRFRGQASARYGTAAGCVSRVNVRHTLRLAQPAVRVSLGAANRNTAAVFATADNRWYLDGTYRLDGEKRLNAEIRRSEL